jgi:hypothetical protein
VKAPRCWCSAPLLAVATAACCCCWSCCEYYLSLSLSISWLLRCATVRRSTEEDLRQLLLPNECPRMCLKCWAFF